MRAAVLNNSRRLEVRDLPDPEPAPGSVVVRVSACGICGSDLHMVSSGIAAPGIVLGHEASGVIEGVGGEVRGFAPGDPNTFRADLATRLGADHAGTPQEADIVVECAGAPGTLDLAVGSVCDGGQVILLAVNMDGDTVYPFSWVTNEVDVLGALAYTRDEYDEAADMIATGQLDVGAMITRHVSLEETDEAFFALLSGAPEGKVLITP